MKRGLKITLTSVLGLILIVAIVLALLTNLNWARPWINNKVNIATERSFAINGDLTLSWEKPPYEEGGLHRWMPWPHFRAKDIVLGNPAWATTGPDMARIQQVDFTVDLWRLLNKTINLRSVILTEPQLSFEASKDSKNNWTFPQKESKSDWEFHLEDMTIARGTARYVDPIKRADVTARIDTSKDGSVAWKLKGSFNKEKLTGEGTAGALLSLQSHDVKYPVKAELKVGETVITADGTLTDPAHLSALDVSLKIMGASMADLFPLGGLLLPETPKFSTEGRVIGNLQRDRIRLRYEKFKGRVGSSDIGGTLEYLQQEPRPSLRGSVVSNYLNFKDLSALIGADASKAKKEDVESKIPEGKVLPVEPFKTDRWSKMDVDVEFSGKKIIRSEDLPIDNLYTRIKMDNSVLSLTPLNFGVAGGKLTSELKIDGKNSPAEARMKIEARGLKLKSLFPSVESMRASLGEVNGNAELSAKGNAVASLLASTNGNVNALITQGTVSKFILEAIGLNVSSVVASKLFGDKQVQLNCMVSDFGVKNGLMQARTFVVDTTDATIGVQGNIDFAKEALNLKIKPESKGIRIISLRSPLHVDGTFKHPDVGIDKDVVALKAGAAIALGAIAAPAAAIVALINPGEEEASPCAELLSHAAQKNAGGSSTRNIAVKDAKSK